MNLLINSYSLDKNNNIRFISCVGIEQLSLIVPLNSDIRVWKDLEQQKHRNS